MASLIDKIKINELIPYVNNVRTHSDDQINQIAASISEFGFLNPVLIDSKKQIIAGHGRVMAAKKLGIEDVPVVMIEHLTEAQKKAYTIADNQLALNAGWDLDLLKLELEHLEGIDFDLDLLGFDNLDFLDVSFSPGDDDDQGKLDQLSPKYVVCPSCGKEFDSREA